MSIKYYIDELGETIEDAEEFESEYYNDKSDDAEFIADEIAEHCFHNRDGWEWMGHGFDMTVITGGVEHKLCVDVRAVPEFDARIKK